MNLPSSILSGEHQMAQLLHHQDSAFYGKELHECRWGIHQFSGFRRRLRSKKMLPKKRHGQKKDSRGSRWRGCSNAPLKNEDNGILDGDKNTEVQPCLIYIKVADSKSLPSGLGKALKPATHKVKLYLTSFWSRRSIKDKTRC